jgi:hypothetical protein
MGEAKKSRNNSKYSADRRDHIRATEFKPNVNGYYVDKFGQGWAVFAKKSGFRAATFDKKKDAEKWLADRLASERAANEARKAEQLGERLGSENHQ